MENKERDILGYKFALEDGVINVYDENGNWKGFFPYYENQDFYRRTFEIYQENFSD